MYIMNNNDVIYGTNGNDSINGESGNDVIFGKSGDDTLVGGSGNDVLFGGSGNDTFTNLDPFGNDQIFGDKDFDVLDLTGSKPEQGSYEIFYNHYSSPNNLSGKVVYYDEYGHKTGQTVFKEIEKVVPCFCEGTQIITFNGIQSIEDLKVGDKILTRDNGYQKIIWKGVSDKVDLRIHKNLAPVVIRKNSPLFPDLNQDLYVSPQHRLMVNSPKLELVTGEYENLVAATHLSSKLGVDKSTANNCVYYHIMFENHQVINSNGIWSESFQPGNGIMSKADDVQIQELKTLFPEMNFSKYTAARQTLRKNEVVFV